MLIQSDYHIHASRYRLCAAGTPPGPTAAEQLAAARAAGSVKVGIVEHCNASPRHPFSCLEELSREFYSPGFDRRNAFLGVEADLADDGSDACKSEGRKRLKLDYVIGSVHLSPTLIPSAHEYIETEYRRISAALRENGNIDVIGHPFGEGIRYERSGAVPKWSFSLIPSEYLDRLIELALAHGKALEINRCIPEDSAYLDFLRKIRDAHVLFSVGSDAHVTSTVADAAVRTRMLEELGFDEKFHWSPKL